MDSLGRLAEQLPPRRSNSTTTRQQQQAEAELQASFKASAQSLVTLLKAAQNSSKKAYQVGYATALQDVLEYLQQGLDIHQGQPSEGIAEVIDYIEARQEAVHLDGSELDGEDDDAQYSHRTGPASSQILRPHGYPTQSSIQPGTSTGTQPRRAQHTHQRQAMRSVSPVQARASSFPAATDRPGPIASTSGTSGIASTAQQHHHPERDVVPSSSLPNSPDYRGRPSSIQDSFLFSSSCPPSSSQHIAGQQHRTGSPPPAPSSAQTTASSASTAIEGSTAQSPLTRLQARREKDRGRRHPAGRTHQQHSNSHGTSNTDAAQGGAGTKRRWTASLLPDYQPGIADPILGMTVLGDSEHSINLDDEDEGHASEENERHGLQIGAASDDRRRPSIGELPQQAQQDKESRNRDIEMDFQGDHWRSDGNGRPAKRIVRR